MLKALKEKCVQNGHFVKFIGSTEVDANLLSLSVPYRVIEVDHPLMITTIDRIEKDLVRNGGLPVSYTHLTLPTN